MNDINLENIDTINKMILSDMENIDELIELAKAKYPTVLSWFESNALSMMDNMEIKNTKFRSEVLKAFKDNLTLVLLALELSNQK